MFGRISPIWCLVLLVLSATVACASEQRLAAARNQETGKPIFELNGKPFYPIIFSDHYGKFSPGLLAQLRERGFNMVQLAVDTDESDTPQFRQALSDCEAAGLPVIVELQSWSTRELLKARPELNMVRSDGERVRYFPDYANPQMRREYLARYARATRHLKGFLRRPVVAISVGAYDAYHLPDGETHVDFVVPPHTQEQQTWLPYGKYAAQSYQKYLTAADSELTSKPKTTELDSMPPPTSRLDAGSDERWHRWLLFRRDLVTRWLTATVEIVRKRSALPVGVSFDLNFAQQEQFATPPFAWRGSVDFLSLYCYGKSRNAEYVPGLMRTAWKELSAEGVPTIGFLEFSSGLSGETLGDAYARECAPFVAGLMTAAASAGQKHGPERVEAFAGWAKETGVEKLLHLAPPRADVLYVANRESTEQKYSGLLNRIDAKRTWDVMYVDNNWDASECSDYRVVVVDPSLKLPTSASNNNRTQFMRSNGLLGHFRPDDVDR